MMSQRLRKLWKNKAKTCFSIMFLTYHTFMEASVGVNRSYLSLRGNKRTIFLPELLLLTTRLHPKFLIIQARTLMKPDYQTINCLTPS